MGQITEKELDFWFKNKWNVLFVGRHGTGKTSITQAMAERNGLVLHENWEYFSAATMDPWVDFIGVPKEYADPVSGEIYLRLIRPENIAKGKIEFLFFDEFNRCLTGDTKISHPDGTSTSIKNLVDKEFFVYSYDTEKKEVVIGKGHSARLTESNAKILKITIDNGTSIRCTANHPFLCSNGKFKPAGELKAGDSLMPLYRQWYSKRQNMSEYEWTFQPETKRWDLTYVLADDYNLKNGIYENCFGCHRHHKDFNKSNNNPTNIAKLTECEHFLAHASQFGKNAHTLHPDLFDRTLGQESSKKKAYTNSARTRRTSLNYKNKRSEISKSFFTEEHKQEQSNRAKDQWERGQFTKIDRLAALHKNHTTKTCNILERVFTINEIYNITENNYNEFKILVRERIGKTILSIEKIKEWHGNFDTFLTILRSHASAVKVGNHRVISVEDAGNEDVYDITVDDYHNFALENGVFVHNSAKKVRNAIMELIQFRSINGLKFPNLKCIWAAVNPADDDQFKYDVEAIDPAQEDRFKIQVEIPYKINIDYLRNKYNDKMASAATDWWNKLPDDKKLKVTPRRLDYALEVFSAGGDLNDVLKRDVGIGSLTDALMNGSPLRVFEGLIKDIEKGVGGAKDQLRDFLKKDNNYRSVEDRIIKQPKARLHSLPLLPMEMVTALMDNRGIRDEILLHNPNSYREIIKNLAQNSQNKNYKKEAQKTFQKLTANHIANTSSVELPIKECKLPARHKERIFGNFEFSKTGKVFNRTGPANGATDVDKCFIDIAQKAALDEGFFYKKQRIQEILPLISLGMTNSQATTVLAFADWFIAGSDYTKLDKESYIHELINTPIVVLINNSPDTTIEQIYNTAPHTIGKYLYAKLTSPLVDEWAIRLKKDAPNTEPLLEAVAAGESK